jgi:hypothetical protein
MSVPLPMPLLGFVTASVLTTGTVALTHPESKHGDLLDEDGITQEGNVPYDGGFTFARIRFGVGLDTGSFGRRRGRGGLPPWAHDYPRAEWNFMNILCETTLLQPYMDGGNIFTTDDPELTRFPMACISEPGYWNPTESEVEGLRNYLLRGGFLIADDFRADDWFNFDAQMKRVIPGAEFVELDETHTIFDSFFQIRSLKALASPTFQVEPVYLGLHEENDPDRRLVVVANYNNDIVEYWEFGRRLVSDRSL